MLKCLKSWPICAQAVTRFSTQRCQDLAEYFEKKVQDIRKAITVISDVGAEAINAYPLVNVKEFHEVSAEQVSRFIWTLKASSSPMEPCPASLIMKSNRPSSLPLLQKS